MFFRITAGGVVVEVKPVKPFSIPCLIKSPRSIKIKSSG